jgi:putative DNA primase/helicase
MVPEILRGPVANVAIRMDVPLDFPASAALVSLSSSIQRAAFVCVKQLDRTWQLPFNLWGALVGPPGSMKSPIINFAIGPLQRIQKRWRAEQREALLRHGLEEDLVAARNRTRRERIGEILQDSPNVTADFLPPRAETPPRPTLRELIVGDITYPKLQDLMADNPRGLFSVHDELTALFARLDRQDEEKAFYLAAENGYTNYPVHRLTRETKHLPALSLSVLGGIVPENLSQYAMNAEGHAINDGLLQRFSLVAWPDFPRRSWKDMIAPDYPRLGEMHDRLLALDHANPIVLQFAPAAQEFFIAWWNRLQAKLVDPDLHVALRSHLTKYQKTVPVLAAQAYLADGLAGTQIPLPYVQQAALCCDCLETHAHRLYRCLGSPRMVAAQALVDKIKRGKVGADGTFRLHDVYRHHWSGLNDPVKARAAVEILEVTGYVRRVPENGQLGRPPEEYLINPSIRK